MVNSSKTNRLDLLTRVGTNPSSQSPFFDAFFVDTRILSRHDVTTLSSKAFYVSPRAATAYNRRLSKSAE